MTYMDIEHPDCGRFRLYVKGHSRAWGSQVAAADTDTGEVVVLIRHNENYLECSERQCHDLCNGRFEHYEMPDGRWLCVERRKYDDLMLKPWDELSEVERLKQAYVQGRLDGNAGKTNWGRSQGYESRDLRDQYDSGYKRGTAEWDTRHPHRIKHSP